MVLVSGSCGLWLDFGCFLPEIVSHYLHLAAACCLVLILSSLPFPSSLLPSTSSAEKVSEVEVMADFTYQPELSTVVHTTGTPGDTTLCTHTQNTDTHLYPANTKQVL